MLLARLGLLAGSSSKSRESTHKASSTEDKRRHNDAALISRLPTEVFEEIIKYAASAFPPNPVYFPSPSEKKRKSLTKVSMRRRLGWIVFTHVCSAWRSCIINLQSLWAAFIGSVPLAMDEMLLRTGNHCPITLYIDEPGLYRMSKQTYNTIRPRIAGIIAYDSFWVYPYTTLLDLARNAPRLETFTAICISLDSSCQRGMQPYTLDAPGLRTLRLENCIIEHTSSVLTHLDIVYEETNTYGTRSRHAQSFLALINCSRATLQSIKIKFRFLMKPGTSRAEQLGDPQRWGSDLGSIISLPHVDTLVVEDAEWILQYLSVPTTASITLHHSLSILNLQWTSDAQRALCAALFAGTISSPRTCAVGISMRLHSEDSAFLIPLELRLKFYTKPFDAALNASDLPSISFSLFEHYSYKHSPPTWVKQLADLLPNVLLNFNISPTTIYLENSALFSYPRLAEAITRPFSSIEHLIVVNPHIPNSDLLEALASAEEGLPELTRLTLLGDGKAQDRRISSILLKRQLVLLLKRSAKLERVSVDQSLTSYATGRRHESSLEEMHSVVHRFDWDIER